MEGLFTDYLLKKLPFWSCFAILILIAVLAVAIKALRGKIADYIRYRKCVLQIIITAALVFAVLLITFFLDRIPLKALIALYLSIAAILIILWLFTFIPTPLAAAFVKKYNTLYNDGFVLENLDKIQSRPWYVFTNISKIRFCLVQYRYFTTANKHLSAYETLASADKLNLLPNERKANDSKMLLTLFLLGAYRAAREKYDCIKNPAPSDQSILAVLYEDMGDFDKSREILSAANARLLSDTAKKSNDEKATTANNLGRAFNLAGNYLAAVEQYRIAVKLSVEGKDIYNELISWSNLILTLAKYDPEEAKAEYEKYKKRREECLDTLYTFTEYANLTLKLHEQLADKRAVAAIIHEVSLKFKTLQDCEYKFNLLVSSASILINNGFAVGGVFKDICENIDKIFALPMPARYHLIHNIYYTLDKIFPIENSEFLKLRARTEYYLVHNALDEIKRYYDKLPACAVFERCHLTEAMTQTKVLRKEAGFAEVAETMKQLWEIYYENNLGFKSMLALLTVVEEAYQPANIVAPTLIPVTRQPQAVSELLPEVCKRAEKFAHHPGIGGVYLQLCAYTLFVGDVAASREYMKKYDQLKISINHVSEQTRRQYFMLNRLLNTNLRKSI